MLSQQTLAGIYHGMGGAKLTSYVMTFASPSIRTYSETVAKGQLSRINPEHRSLGDRYPYAVGQLKSLAARDFERSAAEIEAFISIL